MRASLSRAGAVSELVESLGRREEGVRDALAAALGDPTLELAYWLPELERYVDAAGHEVHLPEAGGLRAATEIVRDGRPVAALIHDAALLDQPELVRASGAAAALALENERLDAELRARYEDLRASRARLVEASDAARRRIERDLHDGAQQRFVSLALTLRLARNRLDAGSEAAALVDRGLEELDAGLSELRELARGIHPAVLSERGLAPALESLAARAPVPVEVSVLPAQRLPPQIETAAYFVVAEALTNVARYAQANEADIAITRENGRAVIQVRDDGVGGADPTSGSGLRGIADRVAALDGRLHVDSPVGGGTVVRAEIPVV
jgi:signal transduction histidine kinase